MTSWHLNIWKVQIWLSHERKELWKWNGKHLLASEVLFLKLTKETRKPVAENLLSEEKCKIAILISAGLIESQACRDLVQNFKQEYKSSLNFLLEKYNRFEFYRNRYFNPLYIKYFKEQFSAMALKCFMVWSRRF